MINKFKIKQINTYGFVLIRQEGPNTEYINYDLDVIKLKDIGNRNDVVFESLNAAQSVLQTYNSKQLLNEIRSNTSTINGQILAIKSVKFKYKVDKDGSEEVIGVGNAS